MAPVHPGQAARAGPGSTRNRRPTSYSITHDTTEDAMRKALQAIEEDGNVTERPQMIRIEDL